MKSRAVISLLLSAISAIAGITTPSLTEMQPVGTTQSGWQVRAALYSWATGLEGDIAIKGNEVSVDVGFDDLFDHLDFAAMGLVEVGRGKCSFSLDQLIESMSKAAGK